MVAVLGLRTAGKEETLHLGQRKKAGLKGSAQAQVPNTRTAKPSSALRLGRKEVGGNSAGTSRSA